ncbi:MAG: TatD family hydrolase [Sphingomonadaceae bacterium]|nr:TatD family hydrolase [Sphingomonadaceae bacterium]
MLIDSHCHLNYPGLVERQADVIAAARDAGVRAMLCISTRESEWADVISIAETQGDIWASVGVHPHEADGHSGLTLERLIAATAHPRVIGIGETGLDYFYDKSDRAQQQVSFRLHIAAARETGLPLIVHMRDAEADCTAILREEMAKGTFSGVIHCFTSTAEFAADAMALGFYISLSGIVTFKNARDLQQVARDLPLDRLLVETDAPFLAPVPHRGKGCEPAFVADTARFVADLRGESIDQLQTATGANFFRLFAKAQC